jgi:hypothetical protein
MDEPKLQPGLYRIYWHQGGLSVAAIGVDRHGKNWIAPTNWVCPMEVIDDPSKYDVWGHVERVELITTQNDQILAHNQELHHRLTRDKSGITDQYYNFSSSENIVAE